MMSHVLVLIKSTVVRSKWQIISKSCVCQEQGLGDDIQSWDRTEITSELQTNYGRFEQMPFIQRSVFFYKAYRLWNPLLIEMLQPRTQSLMSAPRDKAFGTRLEMLHMQDSSGESGTSFTSQMTPGHGNQYTPGSN